MSRWPTFEERWSAAIDITPGQGPWGDCHQWIRETDSHGYGQIRVNGPKVLAPRVAWERVHGPIPAGMHVCHCCDNPRCVNDVHLFLGTNRDNVLDKMAKGRHHHMGAKGERSGTAKLTDEQVREIRARVAGGEVQRAVARSYGVGPMAVSRIVRGERWGHVA